MLGMTPEQRDFMAVMTRVMSVFGRVFLVGWMLVCAVFAATVVWMLVTGGGDATAIPPLVAVVVSLRSSHHDGRQRGLRGREQPLHCRLCCFKGIAKLVGILAAGLSEVFAATSLATHQRSRFVDPGARGEPSLLEFAADAGHQCDLATVASAKQHSDWASLTTQLIDALTH